MDPVPPASADPISGTRLKAKSFVGADGSKEHVPHAWYDSSLMVECSPFYTATNRLRCLPVPRYVVIGNFADPSCTTPVAVGQACDGAEHRYAASSSSDGCRVHYSVHRLGAETMAVYQLSGGSCTQLATAPGQRFYAVDSDVPEETFVEFTEQFDP